MSLRSICLGVFVLLSHPLHAVATPTEAAPPADESDAAREVRLKKAQAILDLATVKFREGRHAEALAELQQAEPLLTGSPVHPLVRFNIARCHEELGQLGDAVRAYERYLDLNDPDETRRGRAATAAVQLRARAEGQLTVTCSAPGARVSVAGLLPEGGLCPVELDGVLAGSYAVTVEAEGFTPETRTVEVRPGEVAAVVVDSKPIVAEGPGLADTPPPEASSGSWVPWALMGAGAASALTGGILHAGAEPACVDQQVEVTVNGEFSHYETECLPPVGDSAQAEVPTAAYAAYGVGGALIIAGVVWLLLDDGPSEQAFLAPTTHGVMVRF